MDVQTIQKNLEQQQKQDTIFLTDIQCQQFDHIENKHILYREERCMKKFFESLREHTKI